MNRSVFSIIGFLLFLIGAVGLVLTLVGLRLTILSPIESLGSGIAFLLKLVIMIFGIIIIYLARTTEEEE